MKKITMLNKTPKEISAWLVEHADEIACGHRWWAAPEALPILLAAHQNDCAKEQAEIAAVLGLSFERNETV